MDPWRAANFTRGSHCPRFSMKSRGNAGGAVTAPVLVLAGETAAGVAAAEGEIHPRRRLTKNAEERIIVPPIIHRSFQPKHTNGRSACRGWPTTPARTQPVGSHGIRV